MHYVPQSLPLDQVLLGDCRQVLPSLPAESVDMVLTDPPYGVRFLDRSGRSLAGDHTLEWLAPAFAEVYRVMKPNTIAVSYYGWTKVDEFMGAWRSAGFRIAGHLTFPKRYASSSGLVRYQHEQAYLLAKGSPRPPENLIGDVIEWQYSGNALHPTQKPTSVLTPLIESFCPYGGTVLDPFAGSGSTLVAARLTGRHGIGIEVEAKMQQTANARLQRMRSRMLENLGFAEPAAYAQAA